MSLHILLQSINFIVHIFPEYCRFPEFLWSPVASESVEKLWMSRASPLGPPLREEEEQEDPAGNPGDPGGPTPGLWTWSSQFELAARFSQITVKNVTRAVCLDQHTNSTTDCLRRDLLHRVVCLAEELGDKFRVQIKGSG